MAREPIAPQTAGARRPFLCPAHWAHMAQSFASAPISEGIPGTGSGGTRARYLSNDRWPETIRSCPSAGFWPFTTYCTAARLPSRSGHCGHGWTPPQSRGNRRTAPSKSACIGPGSAQLFLLSRPPAFILIAAPFSSRLSRYRGVSNAASVWAGSCAIIFKKRRECLGDECFDQTVLTLAEGPCIGRAKQWSFGQDREIRHFHLGRKRWPVVVNVGLDLRKRHQPRHKAPHN